VLARRTARFGRAGASRYWWVFRAADSSWCANTPALALSPIAGALVSWAKTVRPPEILPYLLMRSETPPDLIELLTAALTPHEWLREPYVERPDHLSQMWAAAREQAQRMS